ncbi:FkbM family methyltransferase [Frankia tisae]|uniref:FkbM family methyltransferase n=1 Tax=Frankia tisae TaxID=2950104 RepID=UPI0021C0D394|nr:FkbM family methyltransferase [Frankia tisae]
MKVTTRARRIVDRCTPQAAVLYRRYRDSHTRYKHPAITPWGFSLYGPPGLGASRQSSHEADLFLDLIGQTDRLIDVGANVGLFTILAASKGVPVSAVEPSPMNLAQLYRNLRLNQSEGVEVFPVAASDCCGLAELYGGGQGASLRPQWGGMAATYSNLVPAHTLDGLFADRLQSQRLLIKIDAEGMEFPILRGADRLLAADPSPTWIIEVGLTENFDGQVNPDFIAIFDLFWKHGYTSWCVEQPGRPVERNDVTAWVARGDRGFWNINYLFRPWPSKSKSR